MVFNKADLVSDDPAVIECDHTLAQGGHDLGVVSCHQDRHAHLVDSQQQLDDLPADQGVQVARRLVGDEKAWVVNEGAGDGCSLLLAPGQLAGKLVRLVV